MDFCFFLRSVESKRGRNRREKEREVKKLQ